MNLRALVSRFVSVAALAVICGFSAMAGPINVANFSFETLPAGGLPTACGAGCSFSVDAIPGWSNAGDSGQFQPGNPANTTFFNTLPAGPTIAYSNVAAPPISQVVSPTVVTGVTYTLMVDLGARKDNVPFAAAADLLINGNHIAAIGTAPAAGDWSTFTATYVGLAADSGKSITIELLSSGVQGDFDNVRLSDSTVVPEPAGITLLGLGLVGLSVFARRKRAS
jgi:hypothetical protein